MKINKLFLLFSIFLLTNQGIFAQFATEQTEEKIITFRFVPGKDMFYVPWSDNGAELNRLYQLINHYREEITSGSMPVYVDGYCVSLSTRRENLNTAFIRANRVKSELIVRKGLLEKQFITANYATSYQGHKDIVVITLRIPAKKEKPVSEPTPEPVSIPEPQPVAEPQSESAIVTQPDVSQPVFKTLGIRTNLLYDAFLTPTLGIEWHVNRNVGIRLDGSFAHWGNQHGKVQKIWVINPEIRWYLLDARRFYLGASAHIGEFNLYKYMIGNILSGDAGYQGNMYGGGITIGYQLPLSPNFSLDFNLGLGYTRFEYDKFYLSNEVRVYKDRDQAKNFWGPTQAGISLVWFIK